MRYERRLEEREEKGREKERQITDPNDVVKERYRDGERDKVNKSVLRVRKRVVGRGAREKR